MKKIFFIVNIICLYTIAVIELQWFPFIGVCHNADAINRVLLNISYSILAASIFEFLFHSIPFYADRKQFRIIIKTLFKDLNSAFNLIKFGVNPYCMVWEKLSKEEYVQMGMLQDLSDKIFINKTKKEYIENQINNTKKIAFSLLEYHDYLTKKERSFIVGILNSYLLTNPIIAKDNNVPVSENVEPYNNQRPILESIFDLQKQVQCFVNR